MKKVFAALPLFLVFTGPVGAEGIDLACDGFSRDVVRDISERKLFAETADLEQARIAVETACERAQQSARSQYEEGRRQALQNWFMEDMGGKPGNERLKRKR